MLIESCKNAIDKEICLGCVALEDENFLGNADCEFAKNKKVKQSIDRIHKILNID